MPAAVMDFFAQQDAAARRSRVLIIYLVLAVVLTVLAVYAAATAIFVFIGREADAGAQFWSLRRLGVVAGCTLTLIAAGTFYKIAELAGGGAAVARMLGGRLVPPNSTDLLERRALNVVEEMALASGTPVPALYVLDDEAGMNAFAAGYSPRDAVVAVTRGTLESLNRDELQAVVGHEFSHVLNGDMRLNIRLIGLLNGILLLALVGRGILRSMGRSRGSSKKGGGGAAIALFALALIVIGFIGVFFARLIKSALSRQREYLADASSAQFTRNPVALADALRKIARRGAAVSAPKAEQASHMFFADAMASRWFSLFATHPPLEERIRRLDPHGAAGGSQAATARPAAMPAEPAAATVHEGVLPLASLASRVGSPEAASIAAAAAFIQGISPELLGAARDPQAVVPLVLAALMDDRPDIREAQETSLATAFDRTQIARIARLAGAIRAAGPQVRLPLLSLAVPTLKTVPAPQFAMFERLADAMVSADRQIDLFEFVMKRMLVRRVEPAFRPVQRTRLATQGLRDVKEHLERLLSCLAYWGADDEESAKSAFRAAAAELPPLLALCMKPADSCGLAGFGAALDALDSVSFEHRRRILRACVAGVSSDRVATVEESELLRAVADALDCPVPPLLAGSLA